MSMTEVNSNLAVVLLLGRSDNSPIIHVAGSGQLVWRQIFNGLEQPCVTWHHEEKHQQIK